MSWKNTPSNNLDIHGIEERASGREAVTSATITRTASTATPTLQCDVAIPTSTSPLWGRDAQGADETDFRGHPPAYSKPPRRPGAVRHATVSSGIMKRGTTVISTPKTRIHNVSIELCTPE
ncbi:hypothetical protein EAG_00860 [Camponotus floridanus]|uniref:Uncharacterized protein n=1 Tax=Camponotus floridanus TaxID=104421 RepID=E2AQ96_CAMFO|nr:hypothetical protein EAG_00860 [Camponotus floridanus]